MAKLRKLRETELIGGKSNEDLYPVTVAMGVIDKLGNNLQDYLTEILKTYLFGGVVGIHDSPLDNELTNVFYLGLEPGTYEYFNDFINSTNEICIFMQSKGNWTVYHINFGSGGGSSLPVATDDVLGGIKTGYSEHHDCYAVRVDSNGRAYVCVPTGGGGGTDPDPGDISVTGVTLNKTQMTLTKGNRGTLMATVSPSNATNKNVRWSSSNSGIVTITSTGGSTASITAVSKGTATITVTTEDGNKKATCVITVEEEQSGDIPVTGIILDKTKLEMEEESMNWLEATIIPSNATNKEIIWTSSNPSVATVGSNNTRVMVTAVSKGTTTITASTVDGGYEASCVVTVVEKSSGNVPVTGVTLSPSSTSIEVGGYKMLTAIVQPSNATNKTVTWSSDKPEIASVTNTGRVTGKSEGTATITVTTNDGSKTDTCTVTVTTPIRSYFGVVSDDFVVNEQNIKENTEELNLNSKNYTATVEMDYQKTLYAYPKKYGALDSIKDANGFEYLLSYTRTELSINGEQYYVYLLTDAATIPMFKQIYS